MGFAPGVAMPTAMMPVGQAPVLADPAAAAVAARAPVKLSDALIQSLAVGKVKRDHRGALTGMDFTYDGQHLVTCGEDNSVFVYSTDKVQRTRHLRCEKYGVDLLKFLHNDKDAGIAASRNEAEHIVKYWDFHENRYVRIFKGHTRKITSLCPHPYEDIFLSGAEDQTCLLWDLRQEKPTAKINGHGRTAASFDKQGVVFAACVGHPNIHLFDTRNYGKGEFTCFDLTPHLKAGDTVAHHVQFSPCGKYLLARTRSQLILLDAFDGEMICQYPVAAEGAPIPEGAAVPIPGFSPDSQYVISGVAGGDSCVWSTTNAKLVHRLKGHTTTPSHAMFSPAHALVVTAAETLAWWIPDSAPASGGA